MGREGEEEGVRSYWLTLSKSEKILKIERGTSILGGPG